MIDNYQEILVTNFITILVNFGVFIAVFFLLDQTQIFNIDVGNFLENYGVSFFIGLSTIQILNIGINKAMRK
jgi:hypothetical protein